MLDAAGLRLPAEGNHAMHGVSIIRKLPCEVMPCPIDTGPSQPDSG